MEFWYELDAMSELVSMQPLTETLAEDEVDSVRCGRIHGCLNRRQRSRGLVVQLKQRGHQIQLEH
ncbi:MAG: hypothetical protein ACI9OJ_005186, partial [Myxococcota bacterium]